MRYELTDYEWEGIKPFLPNKPRGMPRVNDRRVLNGIFGVLRSGAPFFGKRRSGDGQRSYQRCRGAGKRQDQGSSWQSNR
jgi:transposase